MSTGGQVTNVDVIFSERVGTGSTRVEEITPVGPYEVPVVHAKTRDNIGRV